MQRKQKQIQQPPRAEITVEMEFFEDPLEIIPNVSRFFEESRYNSAPEFESFIAEMRSKIQIASFPKIRSFPPELSSTFTLPTPRDEFGEEYESLEMILSRIETPKRSGIQPSEIKIQTDAIWRWLSDI